MRRALLPLALLLVAAAGALTLYTTIRLAEERNQAIVIACENQNQRHTDTLRALDNIYAKAERHASVARRQQIAASRAPTVLLIDALAPYQNCARIVTRLSR